METPYQMAFGHRNDIEDYMSSVGLRFLAVFENRDRPESEADEINREGHASKKD